MAKNKVLFQVVVTDKGTLKLATKQTKQLGAAVQRTSGSTKKADKVSKDFHNTQAKGVIGTANGTKSFSKMAQTIGGNSNGLVAAYATLAANVFAVTAAFTALNQAAKTQQVLAGLEQLGYRTGRSLTSAAQGLRNITGNAISAGQAMRSTAQVFAAGFNTQQLQRLGTLAKDTSVALGRNMTDAMDRLIKGSSKLQPQLLDQLGIMVRLDQATRSYAVQLGKNATALTAMQRRQAFMNAVLQQGQRKFGGIGQSAGDTQGYDKLAAAFTDLATSGLNTLNTFLLPLANLLAGSQGLLITGVLLFASTIARSMLPSLDNMSKSAELAAKNSAAFAQSQVRLIKDIKNGPSVFNALSTSIRNGTATSQQLQKAQRSLQLSIKRRLVTLQQDSKKSQALKQQQLAAVRQQQRAVGQLQAQTMRAAAVRQGANAATLASEITLLNLHRKFPQIIGQLGKSYTKVGQAATIAANTGSSALQVMKIRLTAVTVTARVAGAALLNMIPIIGQLVFVGTLLYEGFTAIRDALRPQGYQQFTTVMEQLSELTQSLSQKGQRYNQAQKASINIAGAQIDRYTILSNSLNQLVQKYQQARKAQDNLGAQTGQTSNRTPISAQRRQQQFRQITFTSDAFQGFQSPDFQIVKAAYTSGIRQLQQAVRRQVQKQGGFNAIAQQYVVSWDAAQSQATFQRIAKAVIQFQKVNENLGSVLGQLRQDFGNLQIQANNFVQSSIVSTPYDGLVTSLGSVSSSIATVGLQLQKAERPASQLIQALSGIGSISKNFLSLQAQGVLDDLSQANAQLKAVQDQLQTASGSQRQFLLIQQRNLQLAVNTQSQKFHIVRDQVLQLQKLVQTAQQQSRLLQGQLAIQQQQLRVVQGIFDQTVQGYRARIQGQQKSRALQVQQLQNQKKIQQRLIQVSKIKQQSLQIQIQQQKLLLLIKRSVLLVQNELFKKQGLKVKGESQFADSILKLQSAITQLQIKKTNALAQSRNLRASIASLANQQQAITIQNLSAQQKISRQLGIRVQVAEKYQGLRQQQLQLIQQIQATNGQILSSGVDQNLLLVERINLGRQVLTNTINRGRRQAALRKQQIQATKAQVRADGNRATTQQQRKAAAQRIKDLNAQLQGMRIIGQLQQQSLQRRQYANQLQIVGFNTQAQGIQWQTVGLDNLYRQTQLRQQIAQSIAQTSQLQKRTALARRGFQISQRQQNAFAIQAASAQLKQAKQTVQIKSALIQAEYALLQAQRVALASQLMVRRAALQQWGRNTGTDVSGQVDQLSNAIQLINNTSFSGQAQLAIQALNRQVDLRSAQLRNLATINRNQITDNAGGRIVQALESLTAQRDARQAARQALQLTAPNLGAVQLIQATQPIAGQIKQLSKQLTKPIPIFFQAAKQIESINTRNSTQIAKSLNGIITQIGAVGSQHSIFNNGRVQTSGHSKGSRHFSDRAIDVNAPIAGLVQATDSVWGPRFDKLAQRFRQMGFDVLWRTKDHYDHLHVSWTQEMQKSAIAAGQSIQQIVQKVVQVQQKKLDLLAARDIKLAQPSQTPQIVVNGHRQRAQPNDQTINILQGIQTITQSYQQTINSLGPQGQLVTSAVQGALILANVFSDAFQSISQGSFKLKDAASVASATLGVIRTVSTASANAKVANIQRQIDIQQARDGQSAGSIAKLAQLQKKKQSIQRKAFQRNKKISMAQAIIATALGVANALKLGPIVGPIMATVIGALGAAQLAIISGTSFQGGSAAGAGSTSVPTSSIRIGTRSNQVDLSTNNPNAGGQIGFLRGSRGIGSSASDFSVIGSPYGGSLGRGYGNRSFITGQKGPQQVAPATGMVTPNSRSGSSSSQSQTNYITIQAIDSKSVQQFFKQNTGKMIGNIRKAANSRGVNFIQSVNGQTKDSGKRGTKA